MSSYTIRALTDIPVLSATRRFEHVTLPQGMYTIKETDHPFPETTKDSVHPPKWFVTTYKGSLVGMTLEAWINLNFDSVPLIEIKKINGWASVLV